MQTEKISRRLISAIQPSGAEFHVWDSELKGFGVRVRATGAASYVVVYRGDGGRKAAKQRVTLGTVTALTPDEARRLAKQVLGDVARGEDPARDKATRRKSMTVKELCERYLEAADKGLLLGKGGLPKKASTLSSDRGRIARHIIPLLGTRLVRDLQQSDVSRFLRDVIGGKTAVVEKTRKFGKAVVRGGRGTAARTVGLLGGILSYAVSEGVIPTNPARGVRRPADARRTKRLSPEEYKILGDALSKAAANPGEAWQGPTAVRLLALTGCRLGEVQKLHWQEVDLAGRCLRLSDSKEGASVRPLGQDAVSLLAGAPRKEGSPFVFPATKGDGHYVGVPSFLRRMLKTAKLSGITAHTLRHSFSSEANDLGFTESTVAALLGHAAGSVTGRYIHHLDSVLLAAADKACRAVAAKLGGSTAGAEVVEFPSARASA